MSEASLEKEVHNKGGKKAVWICVAIIILLIIAMTVLLRALVNAQKPSEEAIGEGAVRGVLVNKDNAAAVAGELFDNEPVKPGYYDVTMTNDWVFPNGTSPAEHAYVVNSAANMNAVYFDVNIEETGELICSSPVLPIGSRMDEIVLNKPLPAGDYNCVMTYYMLNDNYEKTDRTLRIALHITVKE